MGIKDILFVLLVAGLAGFGALVMWGAVGGVAGLVVGALLGVAGTIMDKRETAR